MDGLEPPTDGPFAVAIAPGIFYLIVTDTISGCSAIDSVVVDDAVETLESTPLSENEGELTCDETTFILDGNPSIMPPSRVPVSIGTTPTETFVSNQITVEIDYPDSFWLVLDFGDCMDSALVEVNGDFCRPRCRCWP